MTKEHEAPRSNGWLERIERFGNRLPDPATLFAIGAALVFAASWLAARSNWVTELVGADGAVLRRESARKSSYGCPGCVAAAWLMVL